MEHNRKQKLLMIIALVVGIASLSVGFAAFSVSLNISSQASVTPNSDTFSVKFSTNQNSLVVGAVSPSSNLYNLTTTNGTIDNSSNPTIKGLSATFTSPGQYVEYTFYARNEGEYTAYLNNINFLGDKTCTGETGTTASLVTSACESIVISATIGSTTYTETTPIEGHTLAKNTGEQIKIRLEYLSSGTYADGPMSITFPNVALVYSTIDDSSIQPTITKVVKLESGDLNTPGGIVSIGDQQFYTIGTEGDNVKLLSMYNLYVGGEYNSSWTAYGDEATGKQDQNMLGYVSGQSVRKGTTAFSSDTQKGTNYSDYSGSIVEGYVNAYKDILEGEEYGIDVVEARLISYDELTDSETFACAEYDYCSDKYPWIYSTSYWSGSASSTLDVWLVDSYGCFGSSGYDGDDYFGVRPVIIISKSNF